MPNPCKPLALAPGSTIAVVAPASSAKEERIQRGCETLERLDYRVKRYTSKGGPDGYFSGALAERRKHLQEALTRPNIRAVFCSRGGYGSTEILDGLKVAQLKQAKIFCAFSDLTSVHIFLWQKLRWVTFYGPLVAGGFDAGPNATNGYDPDTFMWAMTATNSGWNVPLGGETLARGRAEGALLGGCITLIETSIGTPWELDTRGSILLLEDRGVKPYQLDRMLTHLKQAGKFEGVRGIVLGEFPDSEAPEGSDVTVAAVCRRILGPLRIPVVYGAPIGHTPRPVLTIPLGVRAKLHAKAEGRLEILEPAVRA
ncbi:MAG TPA: LD-carboxypeptidase [Verrucomicrobiae bacterium]|jgi:muramoyltetrapeptide carboxypeptidase|nr:LD-carboxypeptidase [Verrucomicrobiae bacterium]